MKYRYPIARAFLESENNVHTCLLIVFLEAFLPPIRENGIVSTVPSGSRDEPHPSKADQEAITEGAARSQVRRMPSIAR